MAAARPIVVIGAGIVGVLTAYALSKQGRSVHVIDRAPAPAEVCSFGNAGVLAVGHAKAWAGPGALGSIARAILGREPGVRVTRLSDPALWRWGTEFLSHCSKAAHVANSAKLQSLSRFSRELSKGIEADLGLASELRHDGALYLFRDQAQFEAYAALLQNSEGGDYWVLEVAELIAKEPRLSGCADQFAGGIFSPGDSVGDCKGFARRVATALTERFDVQFQFETGVKGLVQQAGHITAVNTDKGPITAEAVVLAAGVGTPSLTRPLGFAPNIYPVKGYSGTWHIQDPTRIPQLPFVDETELVAVASYGGQLRVTALAEFAGHDTRLPPERSALLRDYVTRTFGDAVDAQSVEYWAGLRPSTPSGPPYLGHIKCIENLWINAGHGQLGWTMAAGCADLIAARILGQTTKLNGVSATAGWLEDI